MWISIFLFIIFLIKTNETLSLPGLSIIQAPSCIQYNRKPGKCYLKEECVKNNPKSIRFMICESDQNGKPFTLCCDELKFDEYSPFVDDDAWAKKVDFECGVSYFNPSNKFFRSMNSKSWKGSMNSMSLINSRSSMSSMGSRSLLVPRRILPTTSLFAGSSTNSSNVPLHFEIVAGKNSTEGAHPWIAALWFKENFICGGSIINKQVVMTAAHCFETSRDPSDYTVTVGSHMLDQGKRYKIKKLIIHPEYMPPAIYNDIALIQLESQFQLSSYINAVCLANKRIADPMLVTQPAVVIGFGATSYGGTSSNVLQEAAVPLVPMKMCAEKYNRFSKRFPVGLMDTFLCAGYQEGGKDSCQGDSGGPLMITDHYGKVIQIGIVSFGFRCAEPGYPGVYTNVAFYHQWIKKNAF